MNTLFATLVVLFCAGSAFAQTPTVQTNQPYTVRFDHDGQNTDDYCVIVDKTAPVCEPKVTALADGVPMPPLKRGEHALVVRARNADAFTDSAELMFTAVFPPPTPPTAPRITVSTTVSLVREDGSSEVIAATSTDLPAAVLRAVIFSEDHR